MSGDERALRQKLGAMGDIRGVMSAMRGLALVETRRLGGFLDAGRAWAATVAAALGDVQRRIGEPPIDADSRELCLVFGSERGFCGDYNERLAETARAHAEASGAALLAIGAKLAERLGGLTRECDVPAPDVADAASRALDLIIEAIDLWAARSPSGAIRVSAIAVPGDGLVPRHRVLLPVPWTGTGATEAFPALTQLPDARLLADLTRQHLLAGLGELLHGALLAENRRRVEHMDRAIRRIDRKLEELRLRANQLRQEGITEEIEVIQLGVEGEMA
jgi:F-type H+-transporting ATPase subunit gamma